MNLNTWFRIAAVTTALGFAACTSSSDDGKSGGKGGDNGSGGNGGDTGGKSTGGKGASSGGSGGSAAGGSGGSSGGSGGAVGGAGGAAGKAGGAGGAAGGGAGGAAGGGAGGTSAGEPEVTGTGVFFSGKDMNITKLVAGDAMPGYMYVTSKDTAEKVTIVEVPADPILPANTKYAALSDVPTGNFQNVIYGFNFQMNKDMAGAWNWYNASEYAGIQFFVKASVTSGWNVTTVAAENIPVSSPSVGKCAEVDRANCPAVQGSTIVVTTGWKKFKLSFDEDFDSAVPNMKIDLTGLGRIDFIFQGVDNNGMKLWITGIKLLKANEL